MSVCTVVVAHRQAMVAEGLAAALGRYPGIADRGAGHLDHRDRPARTRADAVAIDADMPEAESRRAACGSPGIRVVFIGGDDSDGGVRARVDDERVTCPAAALNPNGGPAHPRPAI